MIDEHGIIRLESWGPDGIGMSPMQLNAESFQSPLPVQHKHIYYEDKLTGLEVGVWDTTTMQEAFGPYPGDEFMRILEGQVAMVDECGEETLIMQGETFCIRNAIPVSWKQVGYLRKFYMTYANPGGTIPDITSAKGGVKLLDPAKLESKMRKVENTGLLLNLGEALLQRDHVVFTNDSGNMTVGMWECTAFEREMSPFSHHEFVQLIEGEIAINEQDGSNHLFTAGDAFFVRKGTVCHWKTGGYVRKFYSVLDTPD